MGKIKEFGTKVKGFYNKYKAAIWFAAGVACTSVAVILHDKARKQEPLFIQQIDDWDVDPHAESIRKIVEDIFTTVAPEIEDLLFCEGLDEGRIDRDYTVSFPYRGNSENGCYDDVKHVMVLVQDTCQDCE